MPTVLVIAAELMMAMRLEGLLAGVGGSIVTVDPAKAQIAAAVSQHRPLLLIVDLTIPDDVRDAAFVAARSCGAEVIAVGPHTDLPRLAAARAMGASDVLPRSALAQSLRPLVAGWLANRGEPSHS